MITLFRAVSRQEKADYDQQKLFLTGRNTLEAKQFFKSRVAVMSFVNSAIEQTFEPPYVYLMTITVNDDEFDIATRTRKLDGYDAVHVDEDDLPAFNNCVIFVNEEVL